MRTLARPASLWFALTVLAGPGAMWLATDARAETSHSRRPSLRQRLASHDGLFGRRQQAVCAPSEQGFVSIFDGQSLQGWVVPETKIGPGYVVEDGNIVCLAKGGGVLRTEKEYADFVFRFEFMFEEGGNNGVGIRLPEKGHASTEGMEIQIIDDYAEKHKNIKEWQHHGSVYGVIPAKQGSTRPAGQWNSQEIRCEGSRIRVTVNGQVIVDADLSQVTETADGKPHPGIHRTSGFLGFLGHGTRVEFRNLRIKEL